MIKRPLPALRAPLVSAAARALAHLTVAGLALGAGACSEEEPPPPVAPEVTRGIAKCRSLEAATFTLDSIEITVRDTDGLEDLDTVRAVVLSTALELTASEAEAPGEDCTPETCRTYTWSRTPASEQIFCGDDGRLLEVEIEVTDLSGLSARAFVPTQPL